MPMRCFWRDDDEDEPEFDGGEDIACGRPNGMDSEGRAVDMQGDADG